MKKADLDEAVAVSATVLAALLLTLQGKTGIAGAKTKQLCGSLTANAATQLSAGGSTFWVNFADCFEAAQQAGSSYYNMNNVASAANGITVSSKAAIAVKNFAVRMSLAEMARILAATTFTSRQDIDNVFDEINALFEAAELVAADSLDNVSYRLLISIHAAVSNDLANRARPLPRLISYSFARTITALDMSQRLYADPSRYGELIDENKPIHPLFMPRVGTALSE